LYCAKFGRVLRGKLCGFDGGKNMKIDGKEKNVLPVSTVQPLWLALLAEWHHDHAWDAERVR
jgi:hypothetical protein